MPSGRLIVLEGLDGAGITTQTEFLRTWCQNRKMPVSVTKEPTDGPAGGVIKWVLRHELTGLPEESLALLFAADRQHHVEHEITPALKSGATVICDRYYLSSFAYQSVKIKDLPWLRQINSKCPTPDLTVFLDVSPEDCLQRMSSDAWRGLDKLQLYEELALLKEIRGNFLSVIALLKKEGQNIVIVDATGDIQSVGREILKSVTKIVQAPNRSERSNRNSASRQIAAILEGNAISS